MGGFTPRVLTAIGAFAGTAYSLVWSWALTSQTYNIYGSLVVVPIVIAFDLLLIAKVISRNPDEGWLPWVLVLGFFAKTVGTFARYWVAYVAYGGQADAERYNVYASYQHTLWRQGVIQWEWGGKQGTDVMEIITTAIYTVIGGAPLAGFFVFASFAFWGAYLLYRSFRIAVPKADHRRFALLVFFLPSMLYWPSSIGKESWLLLFVGVTALGAARYFTDRVGSLWLLVLGGVGTAAVRPHVAVLIFAALFAAQMFRPVGGAVGGYFRKVLGLAALALASIVLAQASARFLGIDDFSLQAISDSVDWSSAQTQQGGSEFDPVEIDSPIAVFAAFVTVLFRPFPFEAGSLPMLVQSFEGVFLIGLTIRNWKRLRALPATLRGNPFLWFAIIYVIGFVLAFTGFGNFGVLARQRSLMLPFFLMLLSLPRPRDTLLDHLPLRRGEVGVMAGDDRHLMAVRR